jgi:hypothetical protein
MTRVSQYLEVRMTGQPIMLCSFKTARWNAIGCNKGNNMMVRTPHRVKLYRECGNEGEVPRAEARKEGIGQWLVVCTIA